MKFPFNEIAVPEDLSRQLETAFQIELDRAKSEEATLHRVKHNEVRALLLIREEVLHGFIRVTQDNVRSQIKLSPAEQEIIGEGLDEQLYIRGVDMCLIERYEARGDVDRLRNMIQERIDNLQYELERDYNLARIAVKYGDDRQRGLGFDYRWSITHQTTYPIGKNISESIDTLTRHISGNPMGTKMMHISDSLPIFPEIVSRGTYSGIVPILGAGLAPGIIFRSLGAEVMPIEYHRRWPKKKPIWRNIQGFSSTLPKHGDIAIFEDDIAKGQTMEAVLSKLAKDVNPSNVDVFLFGLTTQFAMDFLESHPDVRHLRRLEEIQVTTPYQNVKALSSDLQTWADQYYPGVLNKT